MACSTSEKTILQPGVHLSLKCVFLKWSIEEIPKIHCQAEYSPQYDLTWEVQKTLYFKLYQESDQFYASIHFNGLLRSKIGMVYYFYYANHKLLTEPVFYEIDSRRPSRILYDETCTVSEIYYQFFNAKDTVFTDKGMKIRPHPIFVAYLFPLEPHKLHKVNIPEVLENRSNEQKPDIELMKDLSENIGTLFKNEKFSDVTIVVGEDKFPAHKNILTARSNVFDAMFSHDMKENKENVVVIDDATPEVVHEFLRYLYTNSCHLQENAESLLLLAEKYAVNTLKYKCASFLGQKMNIENVTGILLLAYKTDTDILKFKAMKFVKANAKSLLQKDDFKNSMHRYPDLSYELLTFFAS